jgi:Skp family chaperone for outer membrane proteins
MRFLKMLGLFLVFLSAMVFAANKLGIHDVARITFNSPVRIGSSLLPAGDYVVRHTMEGQDHVMAFESQKSKEVFKVKCTLEPLSHKADQDKTVYEVTSSNERILHELVFRGDTAKHVF